MMLGQLQNLLGDIYGIQSPYDIYDFLVTDPEVAGALNGAPCPTDETLLIQESDGEALVSLYLRDELLQRLGHRDPTVQLDESNLSDFLTALEGVSHFVYYSWSAQADRTVTLLELELQAEIDKFVSAAHLISLQRGQLPRRLHRSLFDDPRLAEHLDDSERQRYYEANRFAGKYCLKLLRRFFEGESTESLQPELRDFYRLPRSLKLELIQRI